MHTLTRTPLLMPNTLLAVFLILWNGLQSIGSFPKSDSKFPTKLQEVSLPSESNALQCFLHLFRAWSYKKWSSAKNLSVLLCKKAQIVSQHASRKKYFLQSRATLIHRLSTSKRFTYITYFSYVRFISKISSTALFHKTNNVAYPTNRNKAAFTDSYLKMKISADVAKKWFLGSALCCKSLQLVSSAVCCSFGSIPLVLLEKAHEWTAL